MSPRTSDYISRSSLLAPRSSNKLPPFGGIRGGLLLLALGCVLQTAHAQYRDFNIVRDSSAWLTSPNAAGLVRYGERNITKAELSTQLARGRFVNFDASPKTTDVNASVESFFRLSSRTVVYGRMGYNNFSGREMAGSAFIPTLLAPRLKAGVDFSLLAPRSPLLDYIPHRPFDIIEDSLTNLGRTHGDTYQLTGSIATSLLTPRSPLEGKGGFLAPRSSLLALGATIDYKAANFAKYKDLRHSNKLSDLTLTLGTLISATHSLSLGADIIYRRNIESLNFSLFGRDDKVYKSLIDYAVMTGRIEQFGNYGFTNNYYEMPLFDERKGFGLQMELTTPSPRSSLLAPRSSIYTSFHYAHRNGYYGKHSPYTITHTTHSGDIFDYTSRLSLTTRTTSHFLTLHINAERLTNRLNSYREQRSEAGGTYYEYYTPVKTGDKSWVEGTLAYTLYLSRSSGSLAPRKNFPPSGRSSLLAPRSSNKPHVTPYLEIHASYQWLHRKQTAYAYPYLRRQKLNNSQVAVDITRHVPLRSALLDININGSFLQGWGAPYQDNTFIQPSDKQTPPPSMDYYLLREHRYLTAPQYTIGGGIKYTTSHFLGLKGYPSIAISLLHRKCNTNPSPITQQPTPDMDSQRDHTTLTMTIGYTF